MTFEDRRFHYGEQRFITLGLVNGEVVVVVTAETDEEIRVISMRKAEQNEQVKQRAGGCGYQTLLNEALKQAIQQDRLEDTLRRVIREELRDRAP